MTRLKRKAGSPTKAGRYSATSTEKDQRQWPEKVYITDRFGIKHLVPTARDLMFAAQRLLGEKRAAAKRGRKIKLQRLARRG